MTDKKTIIQIVIIIAAFSGAGLVLYNGFKGSGGGSQILTSSPAVQNNQDILPYGSSLDFGPMLGHHFQFDIVSFPQLDPGTEVGIPKDSLILPLPPNP